jgi:hypothetical protein
MTSLRFWVIFAATQILGLLIAVPGSPHSGMGFWVVSGILLFPGSALGPFILDRLGISFGYINLPVTAVLVNLVFWCSAKLLIDRVQRKTAT